MLNDDVDHHRRLRERKWFVPGDEQQGAGGDDRPGRDPSDTRAPVSGYGTTYSWYRPGELLVQARASDELREFLAGNKVTPWAPEDTDHWRNSEGRLSDRELNGKLLRYSGYELWTLDPNTDLPALIAQSRERRLARRRTLTLNTVMFGEPVGKYMGGPGSLPTEAARPAKTERVTNATSKIVDVSVLDTGLPFDWNDPNVSYRLQGHILAEDVQGLHEWDLLDSNHNNDLERQAAHGLFICGLINRHAPELRIDPAQVLHPGGDGDEVEIITQGMDTATGVVVNMSLGCYTDDNRPPPAMARAIRRLHRAGKVVVAAAGNNGLDPDYAGRKFWPAAMCEVIAVGAFDSETTTAAEFSNRGRWVDVWAPGVNLVSDYVPNWPVPSPDWADPSDPPLPRIPGVGTSTDWAKWSGTSFAAPLVAAEIARLAHDNPGAAQDTADGWLQGLPFDPVFGRIFAPLQKYTE